MKKTYEAGTFTFTFEGDVPPVTLAMDAVSRENQERAAVHGMLQRLGDAAALSRNEANGFTVTEAMRRAAVAELAAHYASGTKDWNVRTAVGKPAPQNATILAIAAKRGCSYVEAEAYIAERMLAELSA